MAGRDLKTTRTGQRLSLIAAVALLSQSAACASPQRAALGQPIAPQLSTLDNSDTLLPQLEGKVVLLEIWASWCRPCANSLPFLQKLANEHPTADLFVAGINTDEDPKAAEAFRQKHGITFPDFNDPGARNLSRKLAIRRLPTLLVLDREGKVQQVIEGFDRRDEAELREVVGGLLKQS